MNSDWLKRLGEKSKRTRITQYDNLLSIASRDELPDNLGWTIFLIERNSKPLWVALNCPCKCGDRIDVNLMKSRRPCWRIRKYRNTISIYPSLWVSSDKCGSHFFLIRNTVRWAPSWNGFYNETKDKS